MAIVGSGGNISFPSNWKLHCEGWAIQVEHITESITEISDVHPARKVVMIDFAGSAVGKIDGRIAPSTMYGATPNFDHAEGTITLTAESGVTYSGPVVVTGFTAGRDRLSSTAEISFASNGALTIVGS